MKGCELCGGVARMYCESDQASLCWSCDEKVHSANFLVAKHCRNLLCQVCQSPTPWKASGPKLGPTVSICDSCFSLHNNNNNNNNNNRDIDLDHHYDHQESLGGNDDDYDYDSEDEEDDDEEEDEEEEDGDNQVVPWSVTPPSPPVASSSSSEADEEDDDEVSSRLLDRATLKRGRLDYSDDDERKSLELESLKQQRIEEEDDEGRAESRSTAIIDSLKKLQNQMVANRDNASATATILGICRLSRDHHSR